MATQAASSKKTDRDDVLDGVDSAALKEEASDTLENVKDTGKNLISDAKASLTQKASSAVEEKKFALTGGLTSVADSIRKLSGSLNEAEPNPVTEYSAKYADAAASKVEDIARYFENADLKTMSRDVESFARRNPAVFIGGAFALGLLAARFMKSSAELSARQDGQTKGSRSRKSSGTKGSKTNAAA